MLDPSIKYVAVDTFFEQVHVDTCKFKYAHGCQSSTPENDEMCIEFCNYTQLKIETLLFTCVFGMNPVSCSNDTSAVLVQL